MPERAPCPAFVPPQKKMRRQSWTARAGVIPDQERDKGADWLLQSGHAGSTACGESAQPRPLQTKFSRARAAAAVQSDPQAPRVLPVRSLSHHDYLHCLLMMRSFLRALVMLLVLCPALVWARTTLIAPVVMVTSERGGAYDEMATHLQRGLRDILPFTAIPVVAEEELPGLSLDATRIIITIGARAAAAAAHHAPRTPALNTLLRRRAYEQLHGHGHHLAPTSAIFLDQPASRQIATLIEALPGWQVAMIASPHSRGLVSRLAEEARRHGVPVITTEIDSERELFAAIQTILAGDTVLLGVPDDEIFNSNTIKNILLASYKQDSPFMGFSPAYVHAGALLALYSTPAHVAEQAVEAVSDFLSGLGLPLPQHPNQFEVGINRTVGKSLGISLESADTLVARLRAREDRE